MKLSVSIPEDDVAFLDSYALHHQIGSRSATLQRAIRLLRAADLSGDYAQAFTEWSEDEDSASWEMTVADGLSSRK